MDNQNTDPLYPQETKLIDLFKAEGKGGQIEIVGEPIFPLKATLEYLLTLTEDKQLTLTKALQTVKEKGGQEAFAESHTVNKAQMGNEVKILVEGTLAKSKPIYP